MTAFDNLQDLLDPPKRGDTHFMALCPAHPDRNPSLRVTAIPGSVLIHCFAGCDTDTVLHTMGLDRASLFDNPTGRTYEYEDGRVVHRTPDKKFRQTGNTTGTPTLYRLSDVQAAVACGAVVYLVEGEKDADAIGYHWQRCATTTPMGANGITKAHIAPLTGAHIILVPDMDRAGETWLQAAQDLLAPIAATLTVKQPAHGKDVSDHIAAGGTETTLIDPDSIWLDIQALMTNGVPQGGWIVEPLLAVGRQTVIYSAPKVGKSLLGLELAFAIAQGREVLGDHTVIRRNVMYLDLENTLEDIHDRVKALAVDVTDTQNLFYASFPRLPYLDTPQGASRVMELARAVNAELVIIDTASRTIKGEENSNDTWNAWYRHTGMAIKAAGIALLRFDHSGKDTTKGQRGGSAKSGDVDAIWHLTDQGDGVLHLVCDDARMHFTEKLIVMRRLVDPLRHQVQATGLAASFEVRVAATVHRLDELSIGADTGIRKAQDILREAGYKCSQGVVTKAQEVRKQQPYR